MSRVLSDDPVRANPTHAHKNAHICAHSCPHPLTYSVLFIPATKNTCDLTAEAQDNPDGVSVLPYVSLSLRSRTHPYRAYIHFA